MLGRRNEMTTTTFPTLLEEFRKEAEMATQLFFTYTTIHKTGASDKSVHRMLNRHPWFWNTTIYGLQCSLFIVLGRVFDDSSDALSVQKLLRYCANKPQIFALNSLRKRKTRILRDKSSVTTYISHKTEPPPEVMRPIRKLVCKTRQKATTYIDIRNKVFGHKIAFRKAHISALFSKAQLDEVEEMVLFLEWLYRQLWQLYYNGRLPESQCPYRSLDDLRANKHFSGSLSTAERITNDTQDALHQASGHEEQTA